MVMICWWVLMMLDDIMVICWWYLMVLLMTFDEFWYVFLCGTCDELFMNVDDVWCNYDDMLMIFDDFVDNMWCVLIVVWKNL